ncbi:Phytoene dehydrogenase (Phytoene desaturase) [sediment metagenome]|uniref:Phytoene dehydrogenase (Phytoene desaturase) n=1 Tax=sediment metagenome TaxID=749907 RepID=D9PJR7_9ZZZZ
MLNNKKVIVIGAGLGGLSSAAYLAKEGADVTVLEKNDQVGGRAFEIKEKGFMFDAGPSWYLMPDVFEKFFADFGKKPTDYFKLKRLSPAYKIFTEDRKQIIIPSDLEKVYSLFESIEPNGRKKLENYLREAKEKYEISLKNFVYKSYRSPFDFFNLDLITQSQKLTVFKKLQDYVNQNFENDLARKILQYSVVFLGASPNNAPALYSLITHADLNLGVFYPMGGIVEISKAVEKLCREYNVNIKLNESVQKIICKDSYTSKVFTQNSEYDADIVVANADYHHIETQLLDDPYRTIPGEKWDKMVLAPTGFILYLGINKKLNNFEHHNFIWKNDWNEHFKTIFDTKELPKNPSFYFSMPSKTDPSVAPKGKEALFVLIPSAVGVEDSPEVRKHYRDLIINELEKYTGEKIQNHIELEKSFYIKDFEERFNAYKGTGLGLAHTLFQSAIFRPKNFSKKVKNLFYTGQYTNPGTGMPMVLISSKIVLNEIKKIYG